MQKSLSYISQHQDQRIKIQPVRVKIQVQNLNLENKRNTETFCNLKSRTKTNETTDTVETRIKEPKL